MPTLNGEIKTQLRGGQLPSTWEFVTVPAQDGLADAGRGRSFPAVSASALLPRFLGCAAHGIFEGDEGIGMHH